MSFFISVLNVLIVIGSLFLICLILIQRGKGGGLAGAFGGAGGSSAFGTKAGDVFTRITMITALIWIVLLMLLVVLSNRGSSSFPDLPASTDSRVPSSAGKGSAAVPPDVVPAKPTSATDKPSTSPAAPIVSPDGPSAPVPVSPLPTTPPASKP